jgi:uncharacterized ion transporter superfamily protein YfcC
MIEVLGWILLLYLGLWALAQVAVIVNANSLERRIEQATHNHYRKYQKEESKEAEPLWLFVTNWILTLIGWVGLSFIVWAVLTT